MRNKKYKRGREIKTSEKFKKGEGKNKQNKQK